MRALFVIALLGLAAQVSGVARALAATTCSRACDDDDDRGQCPPNCSDCTCCIHVTPLAPNTDVAATLPPVSVRPTVEHRSDSPPSAEPRAILHVPKLLAI